MAFTGPIEDRLLIRERMNAYADATFRSDVEAYLDCWAEGGIRIGNGEEVQGKDALRAQWHRFWTWLDKMTFFTEVGAIEVDGDRATARCWCREILSLKGGATRKVVGVYEDELVRQDGTWRFARRAYTLFMDEGTTA